MTTYIKLLTGLFVAAVLTHCSNRPGDNTKVIVYGDTLQLTTEVKGDTVIKHFVRLDDKKNENHDDTSIYYSKRIDTTINPTGFYFDFRKFNIYFNTTKVIAYCDSIIKQTPADDGAISTVELKTFAKSGKTETIAAGWCSTLMDRFEPLIIDTTTRQKARRLLIEDFSNGRDGHRSYYVITSQGDTALVGYEQHYWN